MIEFTKLVDKGIVIIIAPSVLDGPISCTLRGVESIGVWIESPTLTEKMHELLKQPILEATPLFFVPFSAIAWAVIFLDEPSISEAFLGGEPPHSQ
jgi:hypothetical protein